MKSVRSKYNQLKTVFCALAVLFAIQLLLLYGLHLRTNTKLLRANENVNSYMSMVSAQNEIFAKLVDSVDNKSTQYLIEIREETVSVREKVRKWDKNISEGFLSESLITDELRRLDNFESITIAIQKADFKGAEEALQLEKKVFHSRKSIVSKIVESVLRETRKSEYVIQSCFFTFCASKYSCIFCASYDLSSTFKGVENDISSLVKVADSITSGVDEAIPKSECLLAEMNALHSAFENMEVALRNRSMLSKEQVTQAKQSTEKLEVEVEKSNVEIHKANDQLSRKNEELEQILYAASHDLRTPLIGIQGFSQELQYLTEMLVDELKENGVDFEKSEKLKDIIKQEIPNSVEFILKGSNKMDTMIQAA